MTNRQPARHQGWDMDAALKDERFLRAVDLLCYACMVFDAFCFEMAINWIVGQ